MILSALFCFALLLGGAEALAEEEPEKPLPTHEAAFRILDKITGRVEERAVPVGETRRFENLEIQLHYCRASAPEERPETVVFAEIFFYPLGEEDPFRVFSGWMFASSPSANALEHPIYDVWPIACRTLSGTAFSSKA